MAGQVKEGVVVRHFSAHVHRTVSVPHQLAPESRHFLGKRWERTGERANGISHGGRFARGFSRKVDPAPAAFWLLRVQNYVLMYWGMSVGISAVGRTGSKGREWAQGCRLVKHVGSPDAFQQDIDGLSETRMKSKKLHQDIALELRELGHTRHCG